MDRIANAPGIVVVEDDGEDPGPLGDDVADDDLDEVDGPDRAGSGEVGVVDELDDAAGAAQMVEVDESAFAPIPQDRLGPVGTWAVPVGEGRWTYADEVECDGDGLTTSERDPKKLWKVDRAIARFYPGASLERVSAHRLRSASDFHAFWQSRPSEADALLASQLSRLSWRIEQSRFDGDFGSFPAAWEEPGFELDPDTALTVDRRWRDPQNWAKGTVEPAEVLAKQRQAVAARRGVAVAQAAAARREERMLRDALDGSLMDGSKSYDPEGWPDEFDVYRASLPPGGEGERERAQGDFMPRGVATTSLAREGALDRAAGGHPPDPAVISALLARAEREARLSEAEVVFLDWLASQDDPIGLLSACHYRGERPWHDVLVEAGYGDCLPEGRRPGGAPPVARGDERFVEDVVARLLAPDGGALINRFESAADAFAALAASQPRQDPDVVEGRSTPIVLSGDEEGRGWVEPADARRALSACVPAFGSASHPDFRIPGGTLVVAVPGEPAYLVGDGWACGWDGRLWDGGDDPIPRHLPFVQSGRGPRVVYYRGKRWIRDTDVHRDESAGERLWRLKRLQELRMEALASGLSFGGEDLERAFAPGSHPLDRGLFHGLEVRVDRLWLSAWPHATRILPAGAMYGAGDAAVWRPNPMALIDERRSVWNPGPSRSRAAAMAHAASLRLRHAVGAWSRSSQNRAMQERRFLSHVLRFADFMTNAALCGAVGNPVDVMDEVGSSLRFEREFDMIGFGSDELEPGSMAAVDAEELMASIREAAAEVREMAAADPAIAAHVSAVERACAEWRAAVSEPVGEAVASALGCDPSDSLLEARMSVEREMEAVRTAHARTMAEAGARLVHFPDPRLEGAGAPVVSVPWSGTFRPLAGRGGAMLRAEVAAVAGAWSRRRFDASLVGHEEDPSKAEHVVASEIRAALSGYDVAAANDSIALHKRVRDADHVRLLEHERRHAELHDRAVR